jgi:hypothetical protein
MAEIRKQDQTAHQDEQLGGVEQSVGQQRDGGSRPVVDVVPGQDLMKTISSIPAIRPMPMRSVDRSDRLVSGRRVDVAADVLQFLRLASSLRHNASYRGLARCEPGEATFHRSADSFSSLPHAPPATLCRQAAGAGSAGADMATSMVSINVAARS